MNETILLSVAAWVCATMFAMLIAIGAWLANKLYSKLETMQTSILHLGDTLHSRVTVLDRRVTRVEAHLNIRSPDEFTDSGTFKGPL